jgi:parallel beta-helix repeat protein
MQRNSYQILMALALALPAVGADFYVSKVGNDRWSGTLPEPNAARSDGPFATFERARDAVRTLRSLGALTRPVSVVVRRGTYSLERPFVLTVADSGTASSPTVFEGVPGEEVILSGGRQITGRWTKGENGIYSIEVPWKFRQLFVNGRREIPARYPNLNPSDDKASWLYAVADADEHTIPLIPGTAKPEWARDPNASIDIIAWDQYYNELARLKSVDSRGTAIKMEGRECQGRVRTGNPFYVSYIRSELDAPREWYLDMRAGRLYYKPESGAPPEDVVAPVLGRVIEVHGASYITLRGLTIRHAADSPDQVALRTQADGAIFLESARHCTVERCRISNVDGYGVWLHLDSRENQIVENIIEHTGAGGVLLTGARFSYLLASDIYDGRPEAAGYAPILNRIVGNEISYGGEVRYYNSGVHLDSRPESLAWAPGNLIAFNHIHHMARNGLFAFRHQGGNIIAYNRMHDLMLTVQDGGGIHVSTTNPSAAPNLILGNVIYDVKSVTRDSNGPHQSIGIGVYLDWWTSNTRIENNLTYRTYRASLLINGGRENEVYNNIFADDLVGLVFLGNCSDVMKGNRMERNIFFQPTEARRFVEMRAWALGVARNKEVTEDMKAHPKEYVNSNHNLLWFDGQSPVVTGVPWEAWLRSGVDSESRLADPRFIDWRTGNYRLQPDSPALAVGFRPFPLDGNIDPAVLSSLDPARMGLEAVAVRYDSATGVERNGEWREGDEAVANGGGSFRDPFLSDGGTGKGEKWIRFTLNPPSDGSYRIHLRWTHGLDRSSSTPVEIVQGATRRRIKIDQRYQGFMWVPVATERFRRGEPVQISVLNQGTTGLVTIEGAALIRSNDRQ